MCNEAEKRELYTPEWLEATRGRSTAEWLRSRLAPPDFDRLARWQMLDVASSLPDEMLAKVDQATMACGVEARVPLLDHRIVELAMRLPARLKLQGGEGKWILKRVADRYLPRRVIDRPKRGFNVPVSDWLRGAWRAPAYDVLSASALRRTGMLRHATVARVLAHHESSPGFASSHQVLTILYLQMWLDSHRASLG
jgi:asparagine synthase (glutamine-hydrolysing)